MPLTALVPLKAPSEAKERLAGLLSQHERAELARVTFRTVADALFEAGVPCVVLTPSASETADLTAGRCAVIEEQPGVRGLSAQLEAALDGAVFAGHDAVLILHADLPLASARSIRLLVAAAREDRASVTMVESADGGTNAMIVRLPRPFALHYGRLSFSLHSAAALAAGMAIHRHNSPELALDLDTPADVQTLLAGPDGRESPAGQLLLAMGAESRLAGGA